MLQDDCSCQVAILLPGPLQVALWFAAHHIRHGGKTGSNHQECCCGQCGGRGQGRLAGAGIAARGLHRQHLRPVPPAPLLPGMQDSVCIDCSAPAPQTRQSCPQLKAGASGILEPAVLQHTWLMTVSFVMGLLTDVHIFNDENKHFTKTQNVLSWSLTCVCIKYGTMDMSAAR